MLRVLFVIDETKSPDSRAVVRRRVPRLVAALRRAGVEPAVALVRGAPDVAEAVGSTGTPVASLEMANAAAAPRALARLRPLLRDVDIVQGQGIVPALLAGGASIGTPVTSVFYRAHTTASRRANCASWVAARLCDHTLVPSLAAAASARRLDRTPSSQVHVAPLGTSTLNPAPHARSIVSGELGIDSRRHLLVCVARLREEKGIDVAIQAGVRLLDAGRPVSLIIVGSGPQAADLARSIPERHRPDIRLVGHRDDVAPWFAAADLVVVPSRRESFGQTAIEAMSLGRVVVATNVGGLSEVIEDNRTGILVPPDDSESLASAIDCLLRDEARRSKLGAAAQLRFALHFSVEAFAQRLADTWVGVLALRPER